MRPTEFIADPSDPFANDRLDRKPRVQALCRLIQGVSGPAVLAVCADFGDGKTAFLRMCSAHLRNKGTTVVEFNAWLQGHTEDPLQDLMSALSNELDRPKVLQGLLHKIALRGLRKLSYGLIEPDDRERQIPIVMQEWDNVNEFRGSLQETLTETVEDCDRKLVVVIDELDRCLPKYAFGTLNAARNLLDTPGIVVLLGLNPREIEARICQLYGSKTEAEKFLGRFVDYSLELRRPNAESGDMNQFLDGISASANTDTWLRGSTREYTAEMIKLMVNRFDMSLRDTEHLVHRTDVSLGMQEGATNHPIALQAFLSLLALRVGAPAAYNQLLLDHNSAYDAARALGTAINVHTADSTGLRMIALLILACFGLYDRPTLETFGQAMRSTNPPWSDPQFIERIWAHFEGVQQHWGWEPSTLQDLTDLIELAT